MIVYIHSYDVADAGRTFGRHLGREVKHVVVPESTQVSDVARLVLSSFTVEERSSAAGSIDLLILNSHGSPGVLHLGGIEDDAFDLHIGNAAAFAEPFARFLKSGRSGGQGVEIHGCGVAGGSLMRGCNGEVTDEIDDPHIGFRFLYALACGFESRVMASASPQVSDYDGFFEDTLICASPDSVVVTPDEDDSDDWNGHVFQVPESPLLHEGGVGTRIRAMFNPPPMAVDPRRSGPRVPSRDTIRRPLW